MLTNLYYIGSREVSLIRGGIGKWPAANELPIGGGYLYLYLSSIYIIHNMEIYTNYIYSVYEKYNQ